MKQFCIMFISLSIGLTSCKTSNNVVSNSFFQKRKYNKGYYVNRGSISNTKDKKESKPSETTLISKNYLTKKESSTKKINEEKPLITSSTNLILDTEPTLTKKLELIVKRNDIVDTNLNYVKTPIKEPKIEHLAEISAILGGLSLLLILTGGSLIGIAAIVTGIISLKRQKKYPNLYDKKNKAKAWTGIIVGCISLLAGLLFIGYYLFAMGVI